MAIKEFVIKLFPGIYIKKNFSDLKKATFLNYKEKNVEPELLLLPFLIKKSSAFIDIGSNKGLFLFSALRFLDPSQIFGFEPNPLLFKKIKNVFKKISIFNCALSDKNGEAVLTIPFTKDQPDDSLGNIDNSEISENAFNFKVNLRTLDDCEKNLSGKTIGLIKIDVEGHELDVIKGAEKMIQKYQPNLIVEIEQRHHKENVKKIIEDLMQKFSYRVYYFLPVQNKLIDFSAETFIYQETADFGTINYVNNFIFISLKNEPDNLIAKINSEIGKPK